MTLTELLSTVDSKEALRAAENAVKTSPPRNSRVYNYLGYIRFLRGEYSESARAFAEANQYYPNSSYILTWLWKAEKKAGNSDAAAAIENELQTLYRSRKTLTDHEMEAPWRVD